MYWKQNGKIYKFRTALTGVSVNFNFDLTLEFMFECHWIVNECGTYFQNSFFKPEYSHDWDAFGNSYFRIWIFTNNIMYLFHDFLFCISYWTSTTQFIHNVCTTTFKFLNPSMYSWKWSRFFQAAHKFFINFYCW